MKNEESFMDRKYNEYLNSSDRIKMINGMVYYRAVNIDVLTIGNEKCYEICLSWKMFGRKPARCVKDEYGHMINLSPPAFYSFRGHIPRWYRECAFFLIKRSEIKGTIGKFFTVIEQ